MKYGTGTKPIGLKTICEEIENTCSKADLYKRCNLRPGHWIVPLDSGSGRTTLLEYMAGRYKDAGVLAFMCGLDDYLEITLDGTLPQLKKAFAAIDSAAVYTNEYRNIIGMDISGLAAHLEEVQLTEFLKNCKQVCEHACVVFFVHTIPTRNEEKLLEKLCETIDSVKRLAVEPYTRDDLCALIVKTIEEHGVSIRKTTAFCAELLEMVSEFDVSGVKDAVSLAEALIPFADFSGFTPILDENALQSMITEGWQHGTERKEVK